VATDSGQVDKALLLKEKLADARSSFGTQSWLLRRCLWYVSWAVLTMSQSSWPYTHVTVSR